jgi:hypothetical protein
VFRFSVSKAHSIFRYICHERCVFVIAFKNPRILFSDRSYKRTLTANRSTPFSLRRNKVTWLFTFCTFDCLSKFYQSFSLPSFFVLHLVWLLFLNWIFTLFTFIVHPNGTAKAINIKASTIRKNHIRVKVELNTLYPNVKTMYRSV